MSIEKPVRAAVVGLGYWGPNLVRNLHELPEMEVAWVCDVRQQALATMERRYPAVRRTSKVSNLLGGSGCRCAGDRDSGVDALRSRAGGTRAGKHVLVEKPLAGSSAEASNLLDTARDRHLVLMPGHTFVYSPPVTMIHDLIRSGELGEIYFISTSRVNLGIHQPDVSVVWDLGPHDFSILRLWLGELPLTVAALARGCVTPTTPDVAFIDLRYDSGAIAHVELAWLAPSKCDERRSSARKRWSSTTTRAASRSGCSIRRRPRRARRRSASID